jgi:hypothetical protein
MQKKIIKITHYCMGKKNMCLLLERINNILNEDYPDDEISIEIK